MICTRYAVLQIFWQLAMCNPSQIRIRVGVVVCNMIAMVVYKLYGL
jgi:hypothetical protein